MLLKNCVQIRPLDLAINNYFRSSINKSKFSNEDLGVKLAHNTMSLGQWSQAGEAKILSQHDRLQVYY
jgi:hypothetical protein